MIKGKMFLNPKIFSTCFQMFLRNVYINVFVHDAFDNMKISHSWCCHASPRITTHHVTTTMFNRWNIPFRISSPVFIHILVRPSDQHTLYLLSQANKTVSQNSEHFLKFSFNSIRKFWFRWLIKKSYFLFTHRNLSGLTFLRKWFSISAANLVALSY